MWWVIGFGGLAQVAFNVWIFWKSEKDLKKLCLDFATEIVACEHKQLGVIEANTDSTLNLQDRVRALEDILETMGWCENDGGNGDNGGNDEGEEWKKGGE